MIRKRLVLPAPFAPDKWIIPPGFSPNDRPEKSKRPPRMQLMFVPEKSRFADVILSPMIFVQVIASSGAKSKEFDHDHHRT
jgi:hypothetical protein